MKTARCLALLTGLCLLAGAQPAGPDLRAAAPGTDPPPDQMLRSWLHRLASEQLDKRRAEVERIRTREQLERRKAYVKAQLLRMMGGLPTRRNPLNLRRMGRLDRGDYRVEKIVYESLPKFYVTANLYVPQTGRPPYPAVLHPVGHSVTAKNRAFYQSLSIGLAKQGFVVLTYDPIGQGERRIFYDPELENSKLGNSTTTEHSMVGIQSLLGGESAARYRVWDGIRSIDVLHLLPEVDSKRIGVTGCSGGGTLTTYIAALDERVQAAAPSCYVTSWEEQLKGTGPQDAEQQFVDQFVAGVTHADLVVAASPKPYLICSSTEDFFPLEGARQTFEEARRMWAVYNAAERIEWFYEPGPHGVGKPGREAIYAWMRRWLKGDRSPAREPEYTTEHEEDLNVTATGQVSTSLGGETASTLNIQRLGLRKPARPVSGLAAEVRRLTRFSRPEGPLNLRRRGAFEHNGYRVERLLFDSEPGRYVPALLCIPEKPRPRAAVYLDQAGKAAGLREGGVADELARAGFAVLAIDPAGVGETAGGWPGGGGWFGQEKIGWLALMTGRPLTGLRMADIARAVDVLAEKGLVGSGGVWGIARGMPGVELLHAAALEPRFGGVVVEESLVSYEAVARAPIHRGIFEAVVPGVLGRYDLPDLAAALAPRPVWLLNLRSPAGGPVSRKEVEKVYAHAAAQPGAKLYVRSRREGEGILGACPELR